MTVPNPWLIRAPNPNAPLRLFCFSYAGGSAADFLPWRAALAPRIDVCPLQLPGRGARLREAPLLSPADVVEAALDAVREHLDRPFACFGHSLGALLAFEFARRCRELGLREPARLMVSGCGAPACRHDTEPLHLMDDKTLMAALRRYNGTPVQVLENPELMELVMPTLRADFELVSNYAYRRLPALDLPLSVLAGRADSHVSAEQAEAWRAETRAASELHWFDGDHFFIREHQAEVLERVASALSATPGLVPA
ncbi:thioesterase II family protein [Burkholderia gladioli]|uniref:Thioesterase n=1 Tax=Burkholderia gladioli (strain BSR3) TaxID=999541 RepID=F2LRQ6_BURGS|nr:alpha/beta fold hydrolase [Burkholderia gladioli]AEA65550.1 thioesterase [Burkholderia gladioli BSR3]MBW5286678.1 thioesterase [Burkholderia gladioli]